MTELVSIVRLPEELADDPLALDVYKDALIDEGLEVVRASGGIPTGENSADVVEALFPDTDLYKANFGRHVIRVVINYQEHAKRP